MTGARIGIIGGGIAGLTCAFRLAQAGCRPVVFEAAEEVGGLGSAFVHQGITIDRFYHIMLDSDASLLRLIGELGGTERLVWQETGMGVYTDGGLFPLNGAVDLLRFSPLTVVERLRTAAAGAYLTRVKKNPTGLDDVTAASYLRGLFGAGVYGRIWEPLLRAKFGDRSEEVPAYWIWSRLNREKSRGPERKGYVRDGYRWIAAELVKRIEGMGGEVRVRSAVGQVSGTSVNGEAFDAVISTLPLALLARLTPAVSWPLLSYQGVVNVVLVTRRRVQPYYWTAVIDRDFPFQGVVETTHVIPAAWTGGRHLVYLMNYCDGSSERLQTADEVLIAEAVAGVGGLFPGFVPGDVEGAYVFRAPHVEPVWPLGYLKQRPAVRAREDGLYLCTTAQAYPRVNAWNTSVELAEETTRQVLWDAGQR
jgi:protoporphyrinogen oxidase